MFADKGEMSLFKYKWCKGLEAGLKQSAGTEQQFRKRKALILSDWWSRFGGKLHHLLPAFTCQEKHLREVSLQYNDLIQTDAWEYFCPIKRQLISAGIGNWGRPPCQDSWSSTLTELCIGSKWVTLSRSCRSYQEEDKSHLHLIKAQVTAFVPKYLNWTQHSSWKANLL